jgi:hypothetical protein
VAAAFPTAGFRLSSLGNRHLSVVRLVSIFGEFQSAARNTTIAKEV